MRILIRGGKAIFVYDDAVHASLKKVGSVSIRRASDVEYDGDREGWVADLSPVSPGEKLGPFGDRQEALAAERDRVEQLLLEGARCGQEERAEAVGSDASRAGRTEVGAEGRTIVVVDDGAADRFHG